MIDELAEGIMFPHENGILLSGDPQLSWRSRLHCDVEMRLLAADDRYITLHSVIVYAMLCSSLIVNCIVPIPSASELPATPLTPIFVDFSIHMNSSSCEHMW